MERPQTHQVDELAQRVFRNGIPAAWVLNEQFNDYGKDYLVEVGNEDGKLTGNSFFVQLKGHEETRISADGKSVSHSLSTKHAVYYLDNVKDLPVFLVVVDVNKRKGWWIFLQRALEGDQSWRKQKSITVRLPLENNLLDSTAFRNAVENAKKWLRLNEPTSVHESVQAAKARITRVDPRFDVAVSLLDDKPNFLLRPKERVSLKLHVSDETYELQKKFADLVDRGKQVQFAPGEARVTGSKLFERIEQTGCLIQAGLDLPGSVTLLCRDKDGIEIARLTEIPGRFSGGRKEIWFDGGLSNSPLNVKCGPITPDEGGATKMDINLKKWDGQPIKQLAYFNRIRSYFMELPRAAEAELECYFEGNSIFNATMTIPPQEFAGSLADYLKLLLKARKVSRHFKINPKWSVQKFDRNAQSDAEQLHAVFFENGWCEHQPNVELECDFVRSSFQFDVAKKANKPGCVRLSSECTFQFMGRKIDVGRLVHEYSSMSVQVVGEKRPKKIKLSRGKRKRKTSRQRVKVEMKGTEDTVLRLWREEERDAQLPTTHSLMSSNGNVSWK